MQTTVIKAVAAMMLTILGVVCSLNVCLAEDDGIIPDSRRIDWNPGIEGGIPDRTVVCADVKSPPYNAAGDDTADDTQAIQQALADCPQGQVVYVPEGDYKLTQGINITKGIVLRGAGPKKTKLKFYRTDNNSPNIAIQNSGSGPKFNARSGYTKGSTRIELEPGSSLKAGNLVYITQDNDGQWVKSDGTGGTCTWCGDEGGTKSLGQMLLIESADGNTIEFEPPLYWTYTAGLNPYIKEMLNPVTNAGIEDIFVDNVYESALISIRMHGCLHSWLKNIESHKGQRHIEIDRTYASVVRDSYIHHHHNYIPNHYSVLLGTFSTANLVENNLFFHTKGGTIMCAWGAAGNVIGYNFCRKTLDTRTYGIQSNLAHHGAHPMMNLWEGNIVQKMAADNYWGSISHNTFFRNHATREEDPDVTNYTRFCAVLEANCRYFNFVGNILGYAGMPGDYETENEPCSFSSTASVYKLGYNSGGDSDPADNDPEVKTTLLRHGNFDYFNEEIIWDSEIEPRVVANSYYPSEKPAFFGALLWPPIGPDVPGYVNKIPAQVRFENLNNNDGNPPQAPNGLRVINASAR